MAASLGYAEDSYFSLLLASNDDRYPISDEKYAESLQLQETLMSCIIASEIIAQDEKQHHEEQDHQEKYHEKLDGEERVHEDQSRTEQDHEGANKKMKQVETSSTSSTRVAGESSEFFSGICIEEKQEKNHEKQLHKEQSHKEQVHGEQDGQEKNHVEQHHEEQDYGEEYHKEQIHEEQDHEEKHHKKRHGEQHHGGQIHQEQHHGEQDHEEKHQEEQHHHEEQDYGEQNHKEHSHEEHHRGEQSHREHHGEQDGKEKHQEEHHEEQNQKEQSHEEQHHAEQDYEEKHHEKQHHEEHQNEQSHEEEHREEQDHKEKHHEVANKKMKQVETLSTKTITGEVAVFFCEICMEKKQSEEMFLKECSHSFCSDCISCYITVKIQENINKVTCPDLNCEMVIEPYHCQSIIPKQVFDRWVDALCEFLILGSQKFYCPFKDCLAMLVDDGGKMVTISECPNCRRLFCAQCKIAWHLGISCEEYQRLNMDERASDDIMLMELAKSKRWRRCPNCRFYVERKTGCLHMTCRCRFEFCYGCGRTFSQTHVCQT